MIYFDEIKPVAGVIWFLTWLLGDLLIMKGWMLLLDTSLVQHAPKGAPLGLALMFLCLGCIIAWTITSYKLISRLNFSKV